MKQQSWSDLFKTLILPSLKDWRVLVASCLTSVIGWKWYSSNQKRQLVSKIDAYRSKLAKITAKLKDDLTKDTPDNQLITEERQKILKLPINKLQFYLRTDKLKPIEALEAYQARAIAVTEAKNCICCFITEATEWAKQLESVPKSERGPLHGIPVSVKECFQVKGYDNTAGLSQFINNPEDKDGCFVECLKRLGAVPFCLTNVPQTMKSFGCSNPVFGSTSHPQDDQRTPGGSSGGEACLIALGGSILGIGSDVGGSLRTPSAFCGVVGVKPTSGRIFNRGRRQGTAAKLIGVHSETGFMSQTVDGVILGMKSLLEDPTLMCSLEPTLAPIPWNKYQLGPKRKLKIGWFDDFETIESVPAAKRAVKLAVELLTEDGHEVEHFVPFDNVEIWNMFLNHIGSDHGDNAKAPLKGDLIDPSIQLANLFWSTPRWIRITLIRWVMAFWSKINAENMLRGCVKVSELQTSLKRLEDMKQEVFDQWNQKGFDVIICPSFAHPAPLLGDAGVLVQSLSGVVFDNLLDVPGGVLPMTRVTKADQIPSDYPVNHPELRNDLVYKVIRKAMQGAEGLPMGVHIFGKPFQEEMVLGAMKTLESLRDENALFQPIEST